MLFKNAIVAYFTEDITCMKTFLSDISAVDTPALV